MNPYTQSVINATLPGMQQANALSQNQQANAANSANAFGGSRQGMQQGVAQAQGAQNIGLMLANLNSQNFTQAQAAATGDISRNLTAQTQNQNEAQAKINSDIMASQGLTNTGDSMSKNNVANFNMLTSAGASQSMQAQNQINAQMAKFNQAFNYPQQQLGTLEASLGMTPHDTSTSGQTTQQTTTPTDWASIISKGAGAASDIFAMSDRTMKKDITPAGSGPAGIPVYKFRYKGAARRRPSSRGRWRRTCRRSSRKRSARSQVRAASCRFTCRHFRRRRRTARPSRWEGSIPDAQGALDLHAACQRVQRNVGYARRRAGHEGRAGEHQGPSEDRRGPEWRLKTGLNTSMARERLADARSTGARARRESTGQFLMATIR